MPETIEWTEDVLPIEIAHDYAREHAPFGEVSIETLVKLEEMEPEHRVDWLDSLEVYENPTIALRAMYMSDGLPRQVVESVLHPMDWEHLDTNNIQQVTCSATGETLYQVEMMNPSRPSDGPDGVTFVDENGMEHGGMWVNTIEGEYYDLSLDSDEFVSGRVLDKLRPGNSQSTSIAAFLPEQGDSDSAVKLRAECKGTIRRDLGVSDEDYARLEGHPEIQDLIGAIVRADSDDEALHGWVPVEARQEDGPNHAMEEKVREILNTLPEEYYIDFPTIAVEVNDGPANGKRYVVVPEEHAEEADEWFDPELF